MKFALAIDPGIKNAGVALFLSEPHAFDDAERGFLCDAALIRNPNPEHGIAGAFALAEEMHRWLGLRARDIDTVILECPQSYKAGFQKGDQNDLITLAGYGFTLANAVIAADKRITYKPRDWKGTIDPDKCEARILSRLSLSETRNIRLSVALLMHNVHDAIGIGLKFFGRFEPHRVVPR